MGSGKHRVVYEVATIGGGLMENAHGLRLWIQIKDLLGTCQGDNGHKD
jgi:hypothetical protein